MDKSSKFILLLDDNSRAIIKSSLINLSNEDIIIINSLREINSAVLEKSTNLIVLEGLLKVNGGISDLRLYQALTGIRILYIGLNTSFMDIYDLDIKVYKASIENLSYKLIQSAITNDIVPEGCTEYTSIRDVNYDNARMLLRDEPSIRLQSILDEYVSIKDLYNNFDNKVAELEKEINFKNINIDKLTKNYDKLLKGYTDILEKSINVDNSLKNFEVLLTEDIYLKLDLNSYKNHPQIVYVKEYEDLLFFNTLLETLFYVFQKQGRQSVKLIRLFDSKSNKKLLTIPKYYKKIEDTHLIKDIISNDFICKLGDYSNILNTLLINKSNLNVLIIVDSREYTDTVLYGNYVTLNTCRNYKHLIKLGLQKENTIVNFIESPTGILEDYLSWNYYKELDSLETNDDKFLFLSSRPLIKKILEFSRNFVDDIK